MTQCLLTERRRTHIASHHSATLFACIHARAFWKDGYVENQNPKQFQSILEYLSVGAICVVLVWQCKFLTSTHILTKNCVFDLQSQLQQLNVFSSMWMLSCCFELAGVVDFYYHSVGTRMFFLRANAFLSIKQKSASVFFCEINTAQ